MIFFRYNGDLRSLANFTRRFLRNEKGFKLEKKLKMPQKTKLLIAAVSALCTLPAWAEDAASSSPITANISMVNNYLYRGISKTDAGPAVQGGFDLAAGNGFYIGAWGSNISWLGDKGFATGSSLELDTYAGIKNSFQTDFIYDAGILHYHYPAIYIANATNSDTSEIYGAIGYQWLVAKYSYSLRNEFGVANSKGTNYLDISANYPISDSGVTLGAHYGKQAYKGSGASDLMATGQNPSYNDYKLSVSWEVNRYVFGAAYSRTNAAKGVGAYYNVLGKDLGGSAVILSLRRTF